MCLVLGQDYVHSIIHYRQLELYVSKETFVDRERHFTNDDTD